MLIPVQKSNPGSESRNPGSESSLSGLGGIPEWKWERFPAWNANPVWELASLLFSDIRIEILRNLPPLFGGIFVRIGEILLRGNPYVENPREGE